MMFVGKAKAAEGVTLSGFPMGMRTMNGCDSGESRCKRRVPKVQSVATHQSLRQKDRDKGSVSVFV